MSTTAQQARRHRLLGAAAELAGTGGFEGVQMRAVAEQADVALGTLYRYFPSKNHLLVALLADQVAQAESRTVARTIPGDTPHARVMHTLGRTTRALRRQPRLAEAMLRAFMSADSSVADEVREVDTRLTRMIATAVSGTTDEYPLTGDDAAVVHVIADLWLASLLAWVTGRTAPADADTATDVAVRLLLR